MLHDQLGIDGIEKLKAACDAGTVAKLKGFGVKTQQKILEGIEFLTQVGRTACASTRLCPLV